MIVLGSTGSIGINTLEIAKIFNIKIDTLVAGKSHKLLNKQIKEFRPKNVVVADFATACKINFKGVKYGEDAILEVIEDSKSNIVVNALVGFLGLKPTLKAIECNKKVALANKESLVVAGSLIDMDKIVPIDSEHFGLWYLMQNRPITKMIITASGGAFRDSSLESLKHATIKDALNHPNWSMGKKITIDSATMTNKLFELIEARWLFGDKIEYDAIIETKSIIHALINFKDGSSTAHIANTDMKLPISFALNKNHQKQILPNVDLSKIGNLEFKEIDSKRYPIWKIKDNILKNPQLGVVINAANEVGVEKFLNKKINFLKISEITLECYDKFSHINNFLLDDIFKIDLEVREYASKI